jgi:hypothetical protein
MDTSNAAATTAMVTTTTRRNERWCSPSSRIIIPAIFLLLGVGVLVPWNAFISAKGYFQSRVCSETGDPANASIESWFAMIYNLSSVISLGLLITIQAVRDQIQMATEAEPEIQDPLSLSHENTTMSNSLTESGVPVRTNTTESNHSDNNSKAHAFWLVMLPLALYLVVFLFTDLLVLVPTISVNVFEILTLICLAVCGMCGAIASAGIVATAGLFPATLAMNPFLAGQSVGGVAVSFANFVAACLEDPSLYWDAHCKSDVNRFNFDQASVLRQEQELSLSLQLQAGDDTAATCVAYEQRDWAVFFYFFMGSLVLAYCLLGYAYIDRFQRRRHRDAYETIDDTDSDEAAVDDIEVSPRIGLELNDSNLRAEDGVDGGVGDRLITSKSTGDLAAPEAVTDPDDSNLEEIGPNNDTIAAWSHVNGPATCIFFTFFVTLSLFPGWTSELQSVRQCRTYFRLSNDLYTPFSFLLFNVGDLLGRLLSAKITQNRINGLSTKLVTASLLRFLFFPLLFMCIGGTREGFQIQSDLYSFVIQFSFAVTNGLLVSTAFVHAPTLLPGTTHMQERSSEILTFAVAFGLLSGSLFSFPVASFVG